MNVAHSVLDAESLVAAVEERWEIRVLSIALFATRMRDSYIVEHTQGRAVLQIGAAGTNEAVRRQHAVTVYVATQGGPTVAPFAETLVLDAPEGPRTAMLSSWAKGARMDRDREPAACRSLGEALARLHALPPAPDLLPWMPEQGLAELSGRVAELGADYWAAADACGRAVDRMLPLLPSVGTCGLHGDVDATNTFVSEGRATLIDFDACSQGPAAYDAACFLAQLFAWPWPRRDTCATAFVEGFGELNADQTAALMALRLLRVLDRHLSVIHRHGTAHLTPRFAERVARSAMQVLDEAPPWLA